MSSPAPLPIAELMRRLAAVPQSRASFQEEKTLGALTQRLRSAGRLLYRRPSHLEKITTTPQAEDLVVDGDRLALTEGQEPPRVVDLDSAPEIRALVDTVRGVLAGDLALLRRYYQVRLTGGDANWQLDLLPSDPQLRRALRQVQIEGGGADLRSILIVQANGDSSRMTIRPAA